MTDTHESIKLRYHQMLMGRTPVERLRMGCSMFDAAKQIVKSSILHKNPHCSPQEMKKEIFLRFYGREFSDIQKEKVLKGLS